MTPNISRRDALVRLSALSLTALLPNAAWASDPEPMEHPDPRPGITSEHVLPAEKLAKKRASVRKVYDAARSYPEIFDGLLCGCECKGPMGHRSLLSCYESEQPMGCMACREEAELVGKLANEGKSLAEIRKAVDKEYS